MCVNIMTLYENGMHSQTYKNIQTESCDVTDFNLQLYILHYEVC